MFTNPRINVIILKVIRMDNIQRLTNRKISKHDGERPHIGIGSADLSLLNVNVDDEVKVIVTSKEIRIVPNED